MTSSRSLLLALVVLHAGCESRPGSSTTSTTAVVPSAPSAIASGASPSASSSAEEAHDPLADELCRALHALPEARRADCCKQAPSLDLTEECRRGLEASLGLQALSLDAAEVHACSAALARTYQGCEHVGPNHPPIPGPCLGIVHGRLPAKSKCRSSLECLDGLRCHGAGPTIAGVCDAPRAAGEPCGLSLDVLATYTGQKSDVAKHPECTGACAQQACTAEGPAKTKPAKLGQPCPSGACEEGARCVSGRCVAPKIAGAPCDVDRECIGGCVKPPGAKSGKCGLRCDLP